jgi:hypothetical protein
MPYSAYNLTLRRAHEARQLTACHCTSHCTPLGGVGWAATMDLPRNRWIILGITAQALGQPATSRGRELGPAC